MTPPSVVVLSDARVVAPECSGFVTPAKATLIVVPDDKAAEAPVRLMVTTREDALPVTLPSLMLVVMDREPLSASVKLPGSVNTIFPLEGRALLRVNAAVTVTAVAPATGEERVRVGVLPPKDAGVSVKPDGRLDAESMVTLADVRVEIDWKAPVAPLTEGLVKPCRVKLMAELALTWCTTGDGVREGNVPRFLDMMTYKQL